MINVVITEDHNSLIDGIDVFFKYEEDINIVLVKMEYQIQFQD